MDRSVAQGRPGHPGEASRVDGRRDDRGATRAGRLLGVGALVIPPVLVGVAAFVAIRRAMLPGVDFWDTGELQTVGPLMGTAHPTGFPTYVLLAWFANIVLTPFGEPALRMNILSALCVAVAAGVTVDLARALTRSIPLGVMAGLGLAFTEGVWSIGTHAEAHALHLALMAILLRLLVAWEDAPPGRQADRRLLAAAVVFGLAVGNHSLVLLFAPGIALFVLAVEPGIWRRPRFVLSCALAVAGTAAIVFLELPLRAGPFRAPLVYGRPDTWDGFWSIVLAEQFRGSLIAPFSDLGGKFGVLVARTVAAFGPLAALIPIGLVATILVRPRYALLTGVSLAITCFFAASYDNADIGRYYLVPALIAWTWLAVLAAAIATAVRGDAGELAVEVADVPDRSSDGLDGIGAEVPEGATAGTVHRGTGTTLHPGTLVAVGLAGLLLVPTVLSLGERSVRVDRSADLTARSWVDRTMATLAPNAVVVSWWSYSTPLWYAQHVEGQRPDVTILDDRTRLDQHLGDIYDVIDANLPTRPVYVIRADPREVAGLAARYQLAPIGGPDARFLTRVVGPRDTAS